jgi:hypothetical protein
MARKRQSSTKRGGKLKIGDDWNAIRIIALSQSNPLKAVAELVENSIDAGARTVTITRGREQGRQYLQVTDDGAGVPKDQDGLPNFRYVATHICDSIKRRLKTDGAEGIQGEFGIGLLSFWTVGEELSMTSAGDDGRAYTMYLRRGDPGFSVQQRRMLFAHPGTQIKVAPLLTGLKQLSGEKIQWYLASELRERIRQRDLDIRIVDRVARKQLKVEPREFTGRLLHNLPVPVTSHGEVYRELYLDEPDPSNSVGLYRNGTRVIENITALDAFAHPPWTEGMLSGILDASFLNLTPATRTGLLQDERFGAFVEALAPLERELERLLEEQRRAERERANRNMLRTIHKAFREALLALPAEEYDWFDVRDRVGRGRHGQDAAAGVSESAGNGPGDLPEVAEEGQSPQKQFHEFPGPLHKVAITPASCVLPVGKSRTLRALCRDRSNRIVEEGLTFHWRIIEGDGGLENPVDEIVTYTAPAEPGLVRLAVSVQQQGVVCEAEALVTVTDSLVPESREPANARRGLPGYTLQRAPGELWRSRYNAEQNVIVINSGHRDFVYASKTKSLKLRYISRLYAKELVLQNFPGLPADQLMERLIELAMYTEENLR